MLTVFVTEFVSASLVLAMPQWPHSSETETRTCHQNEAACRRKELVGNKQQKIAEGIKNQVFFLNIQDTEVAFKNLSIYEHKWRITQSYWERMRETNAD